MPDSSTGSAPNRRPPTRRSIPACLRLLREPWDPLRADDREILRLSAWEGLSPIELAAVLGCSHNAAGIRLHRARRALTMAFHARLDQPS